MIFIKPTKKDLDEFKSKYEKIISSPDIKPGFVPKPIRRRRNHKLLEKIQELTERGRYY